MATSEANVSYDMKNRLIQQQKQHRIKTMFITEDDATTTIIIIGVCGVESPATVPTYIARSIASQR